MREVDLGARAFWLVVSVGAACGVLSLFAFRRWSDEEKLRNARNAMLAHLWEFRLFSDEPMLILRAQRDLLAANGRLLHALAKPLLLMALPFAVLIDFADAWVGRAPLQTAESAVVTAHYRSKVPALELALPAGFDLETLPVTVPSENQVSWRIHSRRELSGKIQLRAGSETLEKSISSAAGLQWISEQRSASLLQFLAHPRELPYRTRQVDWVGVQYPPAVIFGHHWSVWFSLAACCGALLPTLRGLSL